MNPILATVDLFPHSKEVLLGGWTIARSRGVPLLVLHVVHETADTAGFYRSRSNGSAITTPAWKIAAQELGTLVAGTLKDTARESGTPEVTETVVHGLPHSRILEVAALESASGIVMHSWDRNPLNRLLKGSVCEYVKKHATCEVFDLGMSGDPSRDVSMGLYPSKELKAGSQP